MKTIQTVITLIERAERKARKAQDGVGIATQNRRASGFWGAGDLQEVYRVTYSEGGMAGDTVRLYHYGTLTAEVWLANEPALLHTYGESRSDADSVNTFLSHFGINKKFTYRPVNGGFMEVE